MNATPSRPHYPSALAAIADPARLRILRRLTEGEATLTDLSEAAEVHPNTVRARLADLEAAGLVVRDVHGEGRPGRPATHYSLAEGWTVGDPAFRGVAELLATALAGSHPDPKVLRNLGRSYGHFLVGRPGERAPAAVLPQALGQLGFEAEVDGDELRLTGCPCPLVSPDDPALVCSLADAVVEGALAAAGHPLRVTHVRHDPERRVCSARIR